MKQLTPNPWENVEARYPLSSKIKGRISSITDYGLFVEVEKGIEGLVHISEISWTERITNLSRHYTVNDEIEVVVVALDKDNRRMSLSIKQMKDDPWKAIASKFNVGNKIQGTVSNITDFGLFVQLHKGVDGLVHVSDISWTEHISHPNDRYKKGDAIEAIILSMDIDHKKISLGIKQLDTDPWDSIEDTFALGTVVEGTVSKITNFGAFIKLSSGIEGLVHISELANREVEKTEDILTIAQKEKFKIIKINKDERKLGLSLKAVTDPGSYNPKPYSPTPVRKQTPRPAKFNNAHTPRQQESGMKGALQQALEQHAAKGDDTKTDKATDDKKDSE